jgi:hypothetical protein
MSFKLFCFTLNNYSEDDILHLTNQLSHFEYIIYGKEVGENGTPHLQGFLQSKERMSFRSLKRLLGDRYHVEKARTTHEAISYCKKEGDFTELGRLKEGGGRTDMESFKFDVQQGMSRPDLIENHSTIFARYLQFADMYIAMHTKITMEITPLRPWQATLCDILKREGTEREILFIVDRVGNTGKSWFAKYFCAIYQTGQIIIPGKKADMAYMLDESKKVFFLDCPRSKQGEFIQYDFLEEIKNRYVFSGKYNSRIKSLEMNHLVVMMNELPDETKLSADRYNITMI